MGSRQRAWVLILIVAVVCAGAVWGVAWMRARAVSGPVAFYRRLPARDALVLYVDFAALRRTGIMQLLTDSKVAEEPEYQQFVRKTDFDYRQDLDAAMVAFAPTGKYALLKGRFDWKSLRKYVEGENGTCYNSVCKMAGSTPERRISFLPLQTSLMAMAVSSDDSAVLRLSDPDPMPVAPNGFPSDPLWLSIPPSAFKSTDSFPAGTRMFARGMENTARVLLSIGPSQGRFAMRLDVLCRTPQDAAALVQQLQRATTLLRDMIEREHHSPNPADLSGVLTSGAFRSEGPRVFGWWPIDRVFIENLLAGNAS